MSLVFLGLLAAGASVDCDKVSGAIARDRCYLARSMAASPPFDCVKQDTQADMNVCSFRDYLRADIELNQGWEKVAARYRGTSASGKPSPQSEFGLMLDAQRAWLLYREKQCDGEGKGYEGGSIRPLIENSCRERITRQRIAEFKPLLEEH